MSETTGFSTLSIDENKLIALRRQKLHELRQQGNAYPTDFRRDTLAAELHIAYGGKDNAELEAGSHRVRISGRMLAQRIMGKASFVRLRDQSGDIQLFVQKSALPEGRYEAFKTWDLGDILGAEGVVFKTKTGELSIKVDTLRLLTKSLRPLPEKFHGLADQETRYRQRYVDLIMNEATRATFRLRSALIAYIREFFNRRGFLEVETPMMQPIPGGAAARPFITHHNALDMQLYLRIAPELYLKRLVVGGFEKVYEINRNFRNEGLSTRHNPEFTMLEIYEAFGDRQSMQDLVQDLICHAAQTVMGKLTVGTAEMPIDLTPPWRVVPYRDLVRGVAGADWFELDIEAARRRAVERGVHAPPEWGMIELTQEIFEKLIEKTLVNPTFVTRLPVELVPLAKACADDPTSVDVFELVIGGREVAPAYSELNDPLEQRRRFEEQAAGDASKVDEDFLLALEHGMPPAGGMGIGIDRLVMMLTGAEAIRDVILFP
ncbi:MAG TPA: lysine--tRNA ligase, partial [Gammaproteobacteria bacterium]|nr:lysine--tRNA ligase [Gammaproteobacteria bacterium]